MRALFRSDYRRSGLKAVTWRVIATAVTMFLVFVFTGKVDLMVGVGFFDVVLRAPGPTRGCHPYWVDCTTSRPRDEPRRISETIGEHPISGL